jgi:hypothetical protein
MKIVLITFFYAILLSSCQDNNGNCVPIFFENYRENQMFGLIKLAPESIKSQENTVCGYKVVFPFWENVDRVNTPKYIFNGYFASVGDIVYYLPENGTNFNKIFNFSTTIRPIYKDTSLLSLKIDDSTQQYKILLEAIDYHRPLKSMIFKYKILNVSLLTPNDNLTLLVSPKHGIIGVYVSFINSGSVKNGKEYVITYFGDIMPYSLFANGAIFEKFQGYE